MHYCFLQHRTLLPSPVTSTTGWCFCFGSIRSFFLELFLHWFPVAYWAPKTWGVHLFVSYLFVFSYCSWDSQGKNTEVVCHSLLQWTTFCQYCPPWPIHLGWPYMAWLSFTELDKACTWNISSQLLQQSTAAAPYLGHVVAPHGLHYWPWTGASPLGCFPLQCYVAMYVPIVTLLIVLGLFFRSFLFPSSFVL